MIKKFNRFIYEFHERKLCLRIIKSGILEFEECLTKASVYFALFPEISQQRFSHTAYKRAADSQLIVETRLAQRTIRIKNMLIEGLPYLVEVAFSPYIARQELMLIQCILKGSVFFLSISVVIPTYNRAHLLPKAVKSVQEQTLQPLEIIIVDDFSTDHTKEVVESFHDEKIKYVVNSRTKGANGARNTGIIMAKGDYIAFQDSDDLWLPKKLEKQVQFMEENPDADMCFCSLNIDNLSRIVPKRPVAQNEIYPLLKRGNFISTQTIFIKTDLAKKILFDEKLMRFQDWDFCLRFAEKHVIRHLNQVLAVAEVQNDSIGKKINRSEALMQFFKKYPELEQANNITKSFHYSVMSDLSKQKGDMLASKIHGAKSFCYEFADKVFNRRNRL